MAATATLTDNFDDTSRDTAKWTQFGTATVFSETGTRLQAAVSTTAGYGGYTSIDTFDLTDSSATVKVISAGNQSLSSLEVYPIILRDGPGTNQLFWLITGNTARAYDRIAGTNTQLASIAYNNLTQRCFRIREASGTTYWEYSADGIEWTTLHSKATPITVTTLYQEISTGTWSAPASATTVLFDDYNTTEYTGIAPVSNSSNTTTLSSYTFSSLSLGTAKTTRTIVVAVSARKAGTSGTLSSATIGGVSATITRQASNTSDGNNNLAAIIHAKVPTGTTGSIVLNFSEAFLRASVQVYRAVNIKTAAYTTAASTAASPTSGALSVMPRGFVLGSALVSTGTTFSWSGAIEAYDDNYQVSATASSAYYSVPDGTTSTTITATPASVVVTTGTFASFEYDPVGAGNMLMMFM